MINKPGGKQTRWGLRGLLTCDEPTARTLPSPSRAREVLVGILRLANVKIHRTDVDGRLQERNACY